MLIGHATCGARRTGRKVRPKGAPLDDDIVRRWGRISGEVKRASGHAPPVIDTMLAATAIEYDFYLVTRNVKDTRLTGAIVFDPWNDDPDRFL